MPIQSITQSPAVSTAGVETRLTVVGDPSGDLRWYVIGAPAGSSLFDADSDELTTLPKSDDGMGRFTADMPGMYTIEARDITITQPLPTYAGEVVDAATDDDVSAWDELRYYAIGDRVRHNGYEYKCAVAHINSEPTEPPSGNWSQTRRQWDAGTDYGANDEVVSDGRVYRAVQASTGQTPMPVGAFAYWTPITVRQQVWCSQVVTRQIGDGQHTATLRVRTYSDTVVSEDDDPDAVQLRAGASAVSRLAVEDTDIVKVLDDIRAVDALARTRIMGSLSTYRDTATLFNLHIAVTAGQQVHNSADNVNTLATSATPSTLAEAISQLNDIRASLIDHADNVGGSWHDSASTPLIVSACTDLSTALALADSLWGALVISHASNATAHGGVATQMADGAGYQHAEAPTTEAELLTRSGELATFYAAHIAKTTPSNGSHLNADTYNTLLSADMSTTAGIVAFANAFADALERHGHNLNDTGVAANDGADPPVLEPFHANASGTTRTDANTKISFRASDAASAWRLLEMVRIRYEQHVLNTEVHRGTPSGGNHIGAGLTMGARLTRAWNAATAVALATPPSNHNESASELLQSFGWQSG